MSSKKLVLTAAMRLRSAEQSWIERRSFAFAGPSWKQRLATAMKQFHTSNSKIYGLAMRTSQTEP